LSEFARFGDPARFEIAMRWVGDAEPRARRPASYGWSMGDLVLTVGGATITRSRRGAATQHHVGWYLAPFFDWLATRWAHLLHEEAFAWPEKSDAVALIACHRALERWIGAKDPNGRARYRDVQAWYSRHALRQAADGGLFPDLFIRRISDDIELSWSASPPLFAPDGFQFVVEPGHARLSVDEVAAPLWEALQWFASRPPASLDETDRGAWRALCGKIGVIPTLTNFDFDAAFVAPTLLKEVREAMTRAGRPELVDEAICAGRPYVETFSPAVAMFGGINPNLTRADISALCGAIVETAGGSDSRRLRELVHSNGPGVPYAEGYSLAEMLLADLDLPGRSGWIDIRDVVRRFEIEVHEITLHSDSISGVAIAGEDFKPSILVNTTSVFNQGENGKRFTIAHELCHVLHDRNRARRVTHISGQWVEPSVERRANAFAAYVLMPLDLVVRLFDDKNNDPDSVIRLAQTLHVNETALIEHLYNLDLIDDVRRERLRNQFRYARAQTVVEKRDRRAEFLKAMEQFNWPAPEGYRFDRDEANER
jgi:Zn-dependent peptidase ImmA (M78 family)